MIAAPHVSPAALPGKASTAAQLAAMMRAVRPRAKARPLAVVAPDQAPAHAPRLGSLKLRELFVRQTAPLF